MEQLTLCKVCFMCWGLIVMRGAAEPMFFLQNSSLTWDEARNHCQVCFQDLVTVTPINTLAIAQNLTSDYWIGLRKSFPLSNYSSNFISNFTSSPDMAWTRWANGDPLAFQNWYPGWPKLNHHWPKISCCSCTCTCPEATTTLSSGFASYAVPDVTTEDVANISQSNLTDQTTASIHQTLFSSPFASVSPTAALPVGAACVKTPVLPPQLPDPDVNDITDSCVAMLSNGAWVERNCTDLLPFVCYDDRFYGNVNVTNVKADSAVLTWLQVPGDISHYRLQVTNSTKDDVLMEDVGLNLTYNLMNLSAGSQYVVTVFAVKCDRDLDNPQSHSFYTIPNKVQNFTFTNRTSTSITLSWIKPDENMDSYVIQYNSVTLQTNLTSTEVIGLTPGTLYNFSIVSGVGDSSEWSESCTTSLFTMPDNVPDLMVCGRSNVSISVNWTKPAGGFTGYTLTYSFQTWTNSVSLTPSATEYTIVGLQPGNSINISVTVVGEEDLQGQAVTLHNFTAPSPISNLVLSSTSSTINASWTCSGQTFDYFEVTLNGFTSVYIASSTQSILIGLNAAALYNVSVRIVLEGIRSDPVSNAIYTKPTPPSNLSVAFKNTSLITFQWMAPVQTTVVTYNVTLDSSYWQQLWTFTVTGKNSCTFSGLTSGTYYTFSVSTVAGTLQSTPATMIQMTDPQPVQLSFSLVCSSAISLNCGTNQTLGSIFTKLNSILSQNFTGVYWVLDNQTSENLAP